MNKDIEIKKSPKKLYIFSEDREIILEDNSKAYVLFEIIENGEKFLVLTNGEAFIFTKEVNNRLEELEDSGEIEILLDLLSDFLDENILVDKDGNSIMDKLILDSEETNE
ncbi:hypothetical protein DMC14_000095 [Metamycoplasma phocicerebrale]|uniref:Uncharacterized protein n=1 Tax=Metamycoplasma phocicerebrale TaxID=142649 RepID=A0A3Q9V810_9BACT|nr:hypothetical protein [Metamycoplasma phocicerebrale]AZZ65217.1 hypothetical protein DMC14_000095 [Metamycoplasma phocicerebrale]